MSAERAARWTPPIHAWRNRTTSVEPPCPNRYRIPSAPPARGAVPQRKAGRRSCVLSCAENLSQYAIRWIYDGIVTISWRAPKEKPKGWAKPENRAYAARLCPLSAEGNTDGWSMKGNVLEKGRRAVSGRGNRLTGALLEKSPLPPIGNIVSCVVIGGP